MTKKKPDAKPKEFGGQLRILVSEAEVARWDTAAKKEHMPSRSSWIRRIASERCDQLGIPRKP